MKLKYTASQFKNQAVEAAFVLQLDITIPSQGISAIFGPSGCGKTTLLRCIAGLEKAQGTIQFNHHIWQDDKTFLASHHRPLAYVFQEASLFDHLNVRGNLRFAQKRADKNGPPQDVQHLIRLLALEDLLDRQTQQLSGGERQRVAIARALLIQPQLLLMDEPLASLDSGRKQEILPFLIKLKNELAIPIIYVSHDVDEVARLADFIVVMQQGQIIATGPLKQVLNDLSLPIQLGDDSGSVIDAIITERDESWQLCKVSFDGGQLWLKQQQNTGIGEKVRIRILARDISLTLEKNTHSSISNILPAKISQISLQEDEPMALIKLYIGTTPILARLTRRSVHQLQLNIGDNVWAQIKSAALIR
ncbi:MAG: molybdenum ABC transporter ATP-binding protein [Pseudomonadales bacterium]|nr:molybdenum ABC transporter ATP-binding protein [Pseudomonadales bacterium]